MNSSVDIAVDIAIVGGGLAGIALANMLIPKGFSVAVVERNRPPSFRADMEAMDGRALALSYTSVMCLKTLKLWSLVESHATPISEVSISVQGALGVTRIKAQDCNLEFLGAVVNADELQSKLYQHLEEETEHHNASYLFYDRELSLLENKSTHWQIELNQGEKIQARLVVGADGSDSFIRQQAGVGLIKKPKVDSAILCNIQHSNPHNGKAFERFTQFGSIAMLPFGNNQSKCVVVLPNQQVNDILQLSIQDFLKYLQREFGFRLGYLQDCSKRIHYGLQQTQAENNYGFGWVLIGNAANTLHPIAAQGFNLGLRDAAVLAEVLMESRKTGDIEAIRNIKTLQTYHLRRESDHSLVRQFTHELAKQSSPWNLFLKKAAVLGCEFIPSLHRWVAHLGLGKQSLLPKLSRGVAL
jgi:2-octaprenyl-6-methoxyphenol hydroxylase